ncbi:PLASTID PROTEIN IMPORT 1, translocon at the outer envelope membrane of chloroplasts 33 [Hibiscus trionum]|uniref:PLASTID PROTEIN IMPORT 1, translocon at the outer envelope membrane of chloroplasts 33 n=1 Tax=Hibiscus trionum TaxID=183268 RepID=A0A9W7MV58_HIBTR|nr:PLASTID PROTEIN IMPORT 1, translocon at the outer envelope membrane of chloroplasts 33 [Hibiscus trionum]
MSTPPPREWVGLQQFPAATQTKLFELLGKLKQENVNTLTILVMGKGGVGKSSTINSLLGEQVVRVTAFQSEGLRPVMASRTWAGFTLNVIDTPGLVEAGYVNHQALQLIKGSDSTIPVVLVENSGRCNKNDNDEKILPNGDAWIPNLVKAITTVATNKSQAIVISKKLVDGSDANDKGKLWIPVILGLQWFVIKWIQGAIKRDIATGNGPI